MSSDFEIRATFCGSASCHKNQTALNKASAASPIDRRPFD